MDIELLVIRGLVSTVKKTLLNIKLEIMRRDLLLLLMLFFPVLCSAQYEYEIAVGKTLDLEVPPSPNSGWPDFWDAEWQLQSGDKCLSFIGLKVGEKVTVMATSKGTVKILCKASYYKKGGNTGKLNRNWIFTIRCKDDSTPNPDVDPNPDPDPYPDTENGYFEALNDDGIKIFYYYFTSPDDGVKCAQVCKHLYGNACVPDNTTGVVKIPEKVYGREVRNIGNASFYKLNKVTDIVFPKTIRYVDAYVVLDCPNIKSVTILSENPPKGDECMFSGIYSSVILYVPLGTKDRYASTDGWRNFKNIVEIGSDKEIKVSSIILDYSNFSMVVGEDTTITATILPEDATDKTVSWTTDNAAVATVSEQGLVTAVGQGTATITCRANDGSGVYATCEVTVKERASWAGKYIVNGQHVEGSSVTKVYPDNFEMTIEEKNGGTYITSMFGNDLTTWNEGGFKLEMNDEGTVSVNLANDNVLDYVSDTSLLYEMYVWDDETGDWCDTWSLRLNEDGTISLGEFYVAAFTWDETDEIWRGRTEALYYDLLAVKDDGSAVHEIAQNQPGIHVHNGVIELDETTDVTVYKENGMIVYQGKTDRVDGLAKGMYIVCVGEQRKKVMIRK